MRAGVASVAKRMKTIGDQQRGGGPRARQTMSPNSTGPGLQGIRGNPSQSEFARIVQTGAAHLVSPGLPVVPPQMAWAIPADG